MKVSAQIDRALEDARNIDLVEQQLNRLRQLWRQLVEAYLRAIKAGPAESDKMAAQQLIGEMEDIQRVWISE